MAIGTSLGAYFEDDFHHAAGINGDPSIDNNTVDPDLDSGSGVKPKPKLDIMPVSDKDQSRLYVSPQSKETPDYDYDSWQKANPDVEIAPGQHYPDTYKLPNHMTFSDESIYHGGDNQGGHWSNDPDGKDVFTPGPTNYANHSIQDMRDYFQRVEPNSRLDLGQGSDDPSMMSETFAAGRIPLPNLSTSRPVDNSPVEIKTNNPLVQFTENDIKTGTNSGMASSGGGIVAEDVQTLNTINGGGILNLPWAREAEHASPEVGYGSSPFESVVRQVRRNTPNEDQTNPALRAIHEVLGSDNFEQQPFNPHTWDAEMRNARVEPVRESFDELMARLDRMDAAEQEGRNLAAKNATFKDYGKVQVADRGYGSFLFKAGDSKVLPLNVSERNGGKTIYVNWIGDPTHQAVNTFDKGTIKGLFKAIADKYPDAERIGGFRISGARAAGGESNNAFMAIPGRKKTIPPRRSIEDLSREWDDNQP